MRWILLLCRSESEMGDPGPDTSLQELCLHEEEPLTDDFFPLLNPAKSREEYFGGGVFRVSGGEAARRDGGGRQVVWF